LTFRVATDKQGSKLVRWAAVEAVQRSSEPAVDQIRARIAERRGRPGHPTGRNIAKVAAARVLLKLVFYGLRDGEIRAGHHLAARPAPAGHCDRGVSRSPSSWTRDRPPTDPRPRAAWPRN
jgi:hypothetical protein